MIPCLSWPCLFNQYWFHLVIVVAIQKMTVLEVFVEDLGLFEGNILILSVGIILHPPCFVLIYSICSYIFIHNIHNIIGLLHRKHLKGYTVQLSRKGITFSIGLFFKMLFNLFLPGCTSDHIFSPWSAMHRIELPYPTWW